MADPVPRLRQVALVAADLEAACAQIEDGLGAADPFHDPGVGEFGLANAVYEIGDTFLEVVSPVQDGTTAGRYLTRRGGDAGYMALFQVADTQATRNRVAAAGLQIVWQVDLPDISGTHLHPRDVPGAIVSFDTPSPPESWRWGGPRWVGGAPADADQSRAIAGLVVTVADPAVAADVWTTVLDRPASAVAVHFQRVTDGTEQGIAAVAVRGLERPVTICGVRFASPQQMLA